MPKKYIIQMFKNHFQLIIPQKLNLYLKQELDTQELQGLVGGKKKQNTKDLQIQCANVH